jgi:hypothetical protein
LLDVVSGQTKMARAYSNRAGAVLAAPVSARARIVLIAFLAVIYLFNAFELRQWLESEVPTGPDQQCYLRQAQLFEEKGTIGGLNTAIEFEEARYLLSKAKALGLTAAPEPQWVVVVAPECHKYKYATASIISQYPPGTGFLLSFFPQGKRVRLLYLVIETILFGWFAYLVAAAPTKGAALLRSALGSFAVIQLNYEGYMSFSLAPSMFLSILLAFGTVKLLVSQHDWERVLLSAICGALLGISVSLRTANILLAGGFVLACADMFLRKRQWNIWPAAFAFAAALGVALIPAFAAHTINAGYPLATTYGGDDASHPIFTWRQIGEAIDYYFFGEGIGYVFDVGLAVTALFESGRRFFKWNAIPYLSFVNNATWMVAAAYYLTHGVLNSYYLIPTALFSTSLIVFGLCERPLSKPAFAPVTRPVPSAPLAAIACVCSVILIAGWTVALKQAPKPADPLPSLESNAIVWADQSGGLFSYYLKRHTATLDRASPAVQRRVIAAVAEDSRPQYLIADSDEMRALIARTNGAVRVNDMFGYEAYRLEPRSVQAR